MNISQSFILIMSGADWQERWKNEFRITSGNYVGSLWVCSTRSSIYIVMYINTSQYIANVCLPSDFFHFFLRFLCMSDDVLLKFWWTKKNCMQFLCSFVFVFNFQPKTIPFCKKIVVTFSKQHTSCIWTARYFVFYCSSKFQNNFIKMKKIESDRALTRSFLWSL